MRCVIVSAISLALLQSTSAELLAKRSDVRSQSHKHVSQRTTGPNCGGQGGNNALLNVAALNNYNCGNGVTGPLGSPGPDFLPPIQFPPVSPPSQFPPVGFPPSQIPPNQFPPFLPPAGGPCGLGCGGGLPTFGGPDFDIAGGPGFGPTGGPGFLGLPFGGPGMVGGPGIIGGPGFVPGFGPTGGMGFGGAVVQQQSQFQQASGGSSSSSMMFGKDAKKKSKDAAKSS